MVEGISSRPTQDTGPDRRDALVKVTIYLEGGGDSKELHTRCRESFRKLLERCAFGETMPRLVACGSRSRAYKDFCKAHRNAGSGVVLMLIDSEDPLPDIETPWAHLKVRDGWEKPEDASSEQVLMMTTCMETWIVADRAALRTDFGQNLQESGLPALVNLESRLRDAVQGTLVYATRNCANQCRKGKRSFQILAELTPDTLSAF
ncbi:MAG: DUF4276 family protein [Planctomyces sp.]